MSFIYSMTATWNSILTTFDGIEMTISNGNGGSAVGAEASRFIRLKNNNTDVFGVDQNGVIATTPTTFAKLPAAPSAGMYAVISDATINSLGGIVSVGGGIYTVQLFYDGSKWTIINAQNTWNDASVTYNALLLNLTNGSAGAPAYNAASRVISISNNGTNIFNLTALGGLNVSSLGSVNTFKAFTGGNIGLITLNTANASEAVGYGFRDNGTFTWSIFKNTNNHLAIQDTVNAVNCLDITPGAVGAGFFNIAYSLDATTTGTGCLTLAGGLGVAKTIFATDLTLTHAPRINVAPTAVTSAGATISNGADGANNLGHRLSFNFNGTTYWIPCGSVAF